MSYAKTYRDLTELEVQDVRSTFLEQVDIGLADECWFWMGYSNPSRGGYSETPLLPVPGRGSIRCQRIMWALEHQIAPAEYRYVTTCGWDLCLNPRHLDCVEMGGEFVVVNGREQFIAAITSETPGAQVQRCYA